MGNRIISVLQLKKLRHRDISTIPKVPQLEVSELEFKPRQPSSRVALPWFGKN